MKASTDSHIMMIDAYVGYVLTDGLNDARDLENVFELFDYR